MALAASGGGRAVSSVAKMSWVEPFTSSSPSQNHPLRKEDLSFGSPLPPGPLGNPAELQRGRVLGLRSSASVSLPTLIWVEPGLLAFHIPLVDL